MKVFIFFTVVLSFCLPSQETHAEVQKKKILVIESYHTGMYWDAGYRKGIKKVIGQKAKLAFFEMDTKRLPKSQYPQRTALAIAKLDQVKPDIVILGDDNALKFVGPAVIERGIPIVFLGINNNPRNYFGGTIPKGMTGVLERPPLKRAIEFIHIAQPHWKKLLVLFDDSNTSKIYKNSPYFFQGKHRITYLGIEVEIYLSNNLSELKDKISQAQTTHDALFLGGLNTVVDREGNHVHWKTITEWTYKHSKIPLFGFWRGNVGFNKSIGGFVADGQYMGEQAAYLADRVLKGEKPEDIRIEQIKEVRLVLSQSSLKHWNIQFPQAMIMGAEYID